MHHPVNSKPTRKQISVESSVKKGSLLSVFILYRIHFLTSLETKECLFFDPSLLLLVFNYRIQSGFDYVELTFPVLDKEE